MGRMMRMSLWRMWTWFGLEEVRRIGKLWARFLTIVWLLDCRKRVCGLINPRFPSRPSRCQTLLFYLPLHTMHRRMYHGWFTATYSHLFRQDIAAWLRRFWLQCKDEGRICIVMDVDDLKGLWERFFIFIGF